MHTLMLDEISVVSGGLTYVEMAGAGLGGLAGAGVVWAAATAMIPGGRLIDGFLYASVGVGGVVLCGLSGYGIAATGSYIVNRLVGTPTTADAGKM